MTYQEQALEFLGITRFHEAGYTGKGIKILSRETVTKKNFPNVIAPKGYATKSGHGDNVMAHIVLVAPGAEHISLSFGGTYKSDTYENNCVDYIIANKVDICTTSLLGGEVNGGKAKAVQDCLDNNCIMICAAGNDGEKGLNAESKSPLYLAIGGVKPTYTYKHYDDDEPMFDFRDIYKTSYSAVGEELDYVTIAEILGCAGTSFCAPVFAAMLALVQQFFKENIGRKLTNSELIEFIDNNLVDTDDEGFDIRTGKGIFVLPEPSSIDLSKYKTGYIDYSGFPQIEGETMTQDFIKINEFSRPGRKLKELKGLVIHWIGVNQSQAKVIRNNFNNANGVYASAHYVIDHNSGHIIQCVPEDEVAFHVGANTYTEMWNETNLGNPNNYLVGIECCTDDNVKIPSDYSDKNKYQDLGKLSTIQYQKLVEFCADFLAKHKLTTDNLYRHYDITGKPCHVWFYKHDNEWQKFKREVANKMAENQNDVSEWAVTAWSWAKEKGYLDGTNPKGTVTREMLAQVLFNLFGKEK